MVPWVDTSSFDNMTAGRVGCQIGPGFQRKPVTVGCCDLGVPELARRLCPETPAPHERRAVTHDDAVIAVEPRLELLHGIEPYDLRAVDAEELLGIQPLRQRR